MSEDASHAAKPGTACLGCRRRKLKCSREQEGCNNCMRADLPCVYPTPQTGVKRKRGPYKKDKAPRERHLEDLVKYLEPKAGERGTTPAPYEQRVSSGTPTSTTHSFRPMTVDETPCSGQASSDTAFRSQTKSGNAEDLVKDALIALTRSSVNDAKAHVDDSKSDTAAERHTVSLDAGLPGSQPSARRMFEYWDVFVQRVDPLLKIIHCPSFVKNLFAAIDRPEQLGTPVLTLLFSIYFAAVSTCTARESRERFGESKTALLERYGKTIEANLADGYGVPALESLQALVLYLIAIRRDNGDTSFRASFSLAVRMAQLIDLHEEPGNNYLPFEAEMRRRLWWHICGLESRAAEEGVARQTSIMEDRNVRIASNLNDIDLDPKMKETPAPRPGVADTSFLVMRLEIVTLAHRLWTIKKRFKLEGRMEETAAIQQEQRAALTDFRSKVKKDLLDFCDVSRRYDWLIVMFYEAMSVKMHMIVEHPTSQIPTREMSQEARLDLLQSSVILIGNTLGISKSEKLGDWGWYFRGYMQWHAVAIVIAELGRSTNPAFANNAWAVLDPVLRTWDETYKQKRDEPAWDHVNALIEKARGMKRKTLPARSHKAPAGAIPSAPETQSADQQADGSLYPPTAYQPPPSTPWPAPPDNTTLAPTTVSFFPNFHNPLQHHQHNQQEYASQPSIHECCGNGFIPTTMQCENGLGLGDFDSLENIDFSAFDAVFGDNTWDSSPSMDFAWEGAGS